MTATTKDCPMLEHDQIPVMWLRDPDRLPAPSDGGEHAIVGIHVCDIPDDPEDPRFVIGFQCSDGRTLRVRLDADRLEEVARVLARMAQERRWRGEPLSYPEA
jgi:hypothetical protein